MKLYVLLVFFSIFCFIRSIEKNLKTIPNNNINKINSNLKNENSKIISNSQNKIFASMKILSARRYLIEFSRLQKSILGSKNFLLNEDIEINEYGAVYLTHDGTNYELINNSNNEKIEKKIVELNFQKTLFQKGWDKVSITTYKTGGSYLQSFLAGYLEGRATAIDIFNFYDNLRTNTKQKKQWEKMRQFFLEVVIAMQNKIKTIEKLEGEEAKIWSRLLLAYSQLEGMIKGYSFEMKRLNKYDAEHKLDLADFLILQADGEVPELLRYFRSFNVKTKIGEKNYFRDAFGIDTEDPKVFWTKLMWTSKCSAFIKLTKDNKGLWKDLLVGHTTWSDYSEMLRSYKHYKFEFENNKDIPSSEMTFSSYPGCLSSTDDFYQTSHNLVITETTLEVIDITKYKYVKPAKDYIPNFMRVLSASRFAKTALEWCEILSAYNSGTYSSQWMILDYNIFKQIQGTNQNPTNMIYMMEQTPEKIVYHDISKHVETHSYFGSFNRAFLEETKLNLDDALITNLYGKNFSYDGAQRGKIFLNLYKTVTDLKTLKDILRYNGFKNKSNFEDPSYNDPSHGISSRSDLSIMANLSGGVDTKITNFEMTMKMTAVAISGPTTDNNSNLPVFNWSSQNSDIKRVGVPEFFNFPYILVSPKTLCCENESDVFKFE